MTVKELKKYLENFDDNAKVGVGGWFSDGRRYYRPEAPCCPPVTFKDKRYGEQVAVIGFFDDCIAHMIEPPKAGIRA